MSNAIGFGRESNSSHRICDMRAVPLSHNADISQEYASHEIGCSCESNPLQISYLGAVPSRHATTRSHDFGCVRVAARLDDLAVFSKSPCCGIALQSQQKINKA